MSVVETPVVVHLEHEGPEIHHLTCCIPEDPGHVALCGTDTRDTPWTLGEGGQDCVVCAELERTPMCPVLGVCMPGRGLP